jgi:hypothetical protein
MNGDTDAEVHRFSGLLYVSFVYRKWSEYRNSVSVPEPRIISCQNTLWCLREVGDWRRLIEEAVSCEASMFSKFEAALL